MTTALPRVTTYPGPGITVPNAVSVNNTVSVTGSLSLTSGVIATVGTSASVTSSQITVTASATQIFAINVNQIFREVVNPTTSTASIWIGAAGVTTTTGLEVPVATAFDMNFNTAALFGICSTGSVTVSTIGW